MMDGQGTASPESSVNYEDFVHDVEMEKRIDRRWGATVYALTGFLGFVLFFGGIYAVAVLGGTVADVALIIIGLLLIYWGLDKVFHRLRPACVYCRNRMARTSTDDPDVYEYRCVNCRKKIFISFHNAG